MGFGSYDESEQEKQEMDTSDDGAGINIHDSEHDGDVSFETDVSTDALVDKLSEIKETDTGE